MGKSKPFINWFKVEITKYVDITNMGDLHWILGIKVCQVLEEQKILLSLKSYIELILQRYGFEDQKPVSTPMDLNVQLTSAQSLSTTEEFTVMHNVPYHEAVGSLMYMTLGEVFTLPHIFRTESSWTARTPHGLRAVRTDFFIPFYLCECAWSSSKFTRTPSSLYGQSELKSTCSD